MRTWSREETNEAVLAEVDCAASVADSRLERSCEKDRNIVSDVSIMMLADSCQPKYHIHLSYIPRPYKYIPGIKVSRLTCKLLDTSE